MNWSHWCKYGGKLVLAASALLITGSAHAAWREASTTHFVIYGEESESVLRKFAENLEKYHSALALATQQDVPDPSPSNRVTVYSVGSLDQVRKLYGEKEASRYLSGFYVPRAGHTFAIVPDITAATVADWNDTLQVLLHEYAHHFVMSTSRFPLPRWANEGTAEFFASAAFKRDGSVSIGRPNPGRLLENTYAVDVSLPELMDPELYAAKRSKFYDSFYGRSWLLYHALVMSPKRQGQLDRYYKGLVSGQSSLDAAKSAFGDLAAFDRELDGYSKRRGFTAYTIKAEAFKVSPVTVRELREGEAAIMTLRIRQNRGVDEAAAKTLLAAMRTFAQQYPKDPAVMAVLAEAEYDAGNHAEAIVAADAALALNPAQVQAHVQKGYALFAQAQKSGQAKDFRIANNAFLRLNAVENDHPIPLIYFHRSFTERGVKPPENAVQGLEKASELAPYDEGVHLSLATQYIAEGKPDLARLHLVPVAYDPHGGDLADTARKMLDEMQPPAKPGDGVPNSPSSTAAATGSL